MSLKVWEEIQEWGRADLAPHPPGPGRVKDHGPDNLLYILVTLNCMYCNIGNV